MADTTGWLIERAPEGVTEWLTLEFGDILWTRDTNEALRFGREIDARRFLDFQELPSFVRITEHMWITQRAGIQKEQA